MDVGKQVDLSRPRYDQSTFSGRARHFFETTDPRNLLARRQRLNEAATLIAQYKEGRVPPNVSEEQLWQAKKLYDSAFHPDTGEKMFILGRMSAQVPMNMAIVGSMLTFYRTPAAIIFWQFANQTFNAIVNYTNRSGDRPITMRQLALPFAAATTTATITALVLNQVVAKRLPPLVARFVPFVAVAAGNSINLPLMRQRELQLGIPVMGKEGERLGLSKRAAEKGIAQVVFSRIIMASPGMVFPPIVMNVLERRGVLMRMPWLAAPLQIFLCGFCLTFATPLCCAIFPQLSSMKVTRLERDLRESIQNTRPHLSRVYFNKGL